MSFFHQYNLCKQDRLIKWVHKQFHNNKQQHYIVTFTNSTNMWTLTGLRLCLQRNSLVGRYLTFILCRSVENIYINNSRQKNERKINYELKSCPSSCKVSYAITSTCTMPKRGILQPGTRGKGKTYIHR